jgi:hypothetical protein
MELHCSCDPGTPGHLARNFEEVVMQIITFIVLLAASASTAFAQTAPTVTNVRAMATNSFLWKGGTSV